MAAVDRNVLRDVLIIGAGPVGCVAALILGRAGLDVTLVEAQPTLPKDLRASTFHPPTLDILAELGLIEQLIEIGLKAPVFQFRDRPTGDYVDFDLACLADLTNFPFRLQCEQYKLTGIAVDTLSKLQLAQVRFGTRALGVTQSTDRATVTVETSDGVKTLSAQFIIGADGSSSVTRSAIGADFSGFTYPEQWLVASTEVDFSMQLKGLANVSYTADPDEWFVLLRVPKLWRVLLPVAPDADTDDALRDATINHRLQGVAQLSGVYPIAHRILYHVHQRVASTYRSGRIIIAGDAAHINNPLGGMGMNGGVHDAVNLAHKLIQILKHGADADLLLDHYSVQRRAIALEYVQAHTHQNKQRLEERDPVKRRAILDDMRAIADHPQQLKAYVRKSAMIDAVEKSMHVIPS